LTSAACSGRRMSRAARTPGSGRAYRHSEVKRRLLEELRSMERPSGTRRAVACQHLRRRGQKIEFALSGPDHLHVVLGRASLIDVDWQQARAGVGYWLEQQARGRGVASRAVRLRALDLRHPLPGTPGADLRSWQCRLAARCRAIWLHPRRTPRSHMSVEGRGRDTVVLGLLPGELS
jgi:hypothetical protein